MRVRPARAARVAVIRSQSVVRCLYGAAVHAQLRLMRAVLPAPGISKYQLGQQVQGRGRVAPVVRRDAHEHIVDARLGVFHENVEVAVVIEESGVEQLVFRRADAAATVLAHQVRIGKGGLRILVKHFHVGMRRCCIQVVIEFLDVLAVIAFAVGQAEQALLEDGISLVPQGERQAQLLLGIGESGNAVFAPSIGAAACVVVRKIVPGIAMRTVVLAHGAPLALTEVWPPSLPRGGFRRAFRKPAAFDVHALNLRRYGGRSRSRGRQIQFAVDFRIH